MGVLKIYIFKQLSFLKNVFAFYKHKASEDVSLLLMDFIAEQRVSYLRTEIVKIIILRVVEDNPSFVISSLQC